MEFTFEGKNGTITLPMNPESFAVEFIGSNKTMEILSIGEVNIPKTRKLQTISIKTFLPQDSSAHYVVGGWDDPQTVVDFFTGLMETKETCRIIFSGAPTDLFGDSSMRMTVENFVPSILAQDDDIHIDLELKEYREYAAQQLATDLPSNSAENAAPSEAERPDDSGEITVGCDVIANGRVHLDSYGTAPGKTLSNYKGKVNLIERGRSHPYHVTTPSGGWLGWMTEGSVRKA